MRQNFKDHSIRGKEAEKLFSRFIRYTEVNDKRKEKFLSVFDGSF